MLTEVFIKCGKFVLCGSHLLHELVHFFQMLRMLADADRVIEING